VLIPFSFFCFLQDEQGERSKQKGRGNVTSGDLGGTNVRGNKNPPRVGRVPEGDRGHLQS
jgi:hypothetical protein